jgi:hypothetical protein
MVPVVVYRTTTTYLLQGGGSINPPCKPTKARTCPGAKKDYWRSDYVMIANSGHHSCKGIEYFESNLIRSVAKVIIFTVEKIISLCVSSWSANRMWHLQYQQV